MNKYIETKKQSHNSQNDFFLLLKPKNAKKKKINCHQLRIVFKRCDYLSHDSKRALRKCRPLPRHVIIIENNVIMENPDFFFLYLDGDPDQSQT